MDINKYVEDETPKIERVEWVQKEKAYAVVVKGTSSSEK